MNPPPIPHPPSTTGRYLLYAISTTPFFFLGRCSTLSPLAQQFSGSGPSRIPSIFGSSGPVCNTVGHSPVCPGCIRISAQVYVTVVVARPTRNLPLYPYGPVSVHRGCYHPFSQYHRLYCRLICLGERNWGRRKSLFPNPPCFHLFSIHNSPDIALHTLLFPWTQTRRRLRRSSFGPGRPSSRNLLPYPFT